MLKSTADSVIKTIKVSEEDEIQINCKSIEVRTYSHSSFKKMFEAIKENSAEYEVNTNLHERTLTIKSLFTLPDHDEEGNSMIRIVFDWYYNKDIDAADLILQGALNL